MAVHTASGQRFERLSDARGRFFLPALPVGEYVLSVARDGFTETTERGVVLLVGQKVSLRVVLQLGERTENVTVTAVSPFLQTTTSEVADVVSNRQVVQLPLNGRQFLQLAQLSDGVVIPPGGTRGAALEQAGALPAVFGQRSGHNIYLLDGVKVTDEYFNNLVITPSVDAIQEFKIQKTMYPAEFGGKASALINVVSKSGSNAFHGSGLEFLRDDTFDARNYFDDPAQPVPPLRQHQFGVEPRRPDQPRTARFFFVSYEGQRIHAFADADLLGGAGGVAGRRLLRTGAALRSDDAHGRRRLHRVRGQPDSGRPPRSGGAGAARQRAAADQRPAVQNLLSVANQVTDHGSVLAAHRPSILGERSAVRPLQHLRRRRCPAVRHQRAQRIAGARIRPGGDDPRPQPGA